MIDEREFKYVQCIDGIRSGTVSKIIDNLVAPTGWNIISTELTRFSVHVHLKRPWEKDDPQVNMGRFRNVVIKLQFVTTSFDWTMNSPNPIKSLADDANLELFHALAGELGYSYTEMRM